MVLKISTYYIEHLKNGSFDPNHVVIQHWAKLNFCFGKSLAPVFRWKSVSRFFLTRWFASMQQMLMKWSLAKKSLIVTSSTVCKKKSVSVAKVCLTTDVKHLSGHSRKKSMSSAKKFFVKICKISDHTMLSNCHIVQNFAQGVFLFANKLLFADSCFFTGCLVFFSCQSIFLSFVLLGKNFENHKNFTLSSSALTRLADES